MVSSRTPSARFQPRAILAVLVLLGLGNSWLNAAPPVGEARASMAVVAHRGLFLHAPENTLPAFRACLELRLGFELDVRRTADGVLVCLHDATVDRTTSGTGPVTEMTLKQLQSLDAGGWFDAAFSGARVPTLDAVFALLAEYPARQCQITVDMKGEDPQIEADVIALAEKHRVLPRLVFIGRAIDHADVRARLLKANPQAAVAVLANNASELEKALAETLARWAYLRFVPSAEQMEAARKAGKKVFIAGPAVAGEQTAAWRAAAEVGVDGILTDYPLELQAELRRRSRRLSKAALQP